MSEISIHLHENLFLRFREHVYIYGQGKCKNSYACDIFLLDCSCEMRNNVLIVLCGVNKWGSFLTYVLLLQLQEFSMQCFHFPAKSYPEKLFSHFPIPAIFSFSFEKLSNFFSYQYDFRSRKIARRKIILPFFNAISRFSSKKLPKGKFFVISQFDFFTQVFTCRKIGKCMYSRNIKRI